MSGHVREDYIHGDKARWAEIARETRIIAAATGAIAEAKRALEKHGAENTMDAPSKTDGERLAILVEEVGEVAKELTYDHAGVILESIPGHRGLDCEMKSDSFAGTMLLPEGRSEWLLVDDLTDDALALFGYRRVTQQERLRKELIQTAAMALTWAAMLP